ncbi:MAG: iron-sulfur cluster assembly accessory protein [Planctomycetes bacterium]|nr:iron-sulfur cluster assembly accessory protein [Planctomycetota bacterium]
MITVTERAAQEVRRILRDQKLPENTCLRLGVKGGGCSGLSYTIGFADAPADGDHVHEEHGLRILIDPKSALFIEELEFGFQESLLGRGFVFNNPKAKRSCGCGKSFS